MKEKKDYTVIDEHVRKYAKWSDFQQNCPDKTSVWTFYQRRKILGLSNSSTKRTKRISDVEKLKTLLLASPQGISKSDISEQLGMVGKQLSNVLYGLRTKVGNKNFIKKGNIIVLKNDNTPIPIQTLQKGVAQTFEKNGNGLKRILNLKHNQSIPQSDINDYLDCIKKSIYYQISAEGIIKANEIVEEMRQQLSI